MAERWFKAWVVPEDHWLRVDMKWLGAWYDLIGLAEWQEGVKVKRGTMFDTRRGVVYLSINELAERWGWTWRTVKRFISMLEKDGMVKNIEQNGEQNVFLNNYAKYQDIVQNTKQKPRHSTEQNTGQNREQNTEQNKRQFLPNEEEYKEHIEGESRETKRATRFVPPALGEVLQFISENHYAVDGRRFFEHYESVGWMVGRNKMKDWKAAVRKWAAEDEQDRKTRAAPAPKKFDNFEPRETQGSAMDEYIKRLEEGYD